MWGLDQPLLKIKDVGRAARQAVKVGLLEPPVLKMQENRLTVSKGLSAIQGQSYRVGSPSLQRPAVCSTLEVKII